MANNYFYNNLKIQLKARFRVQEFLESKNSNLNTPKDSKLINIEEIDPKPLKKNKKKSIILNYHKFLNKTNLLKQIASKMSTNEMYSKEKDCLIKCDDTIKEIETYKNYFKIPQLPKIENRRKNSSVKNIKIYKSNNISSEKSNYLESIMPQSQSLPTYSSSKRKASFNNNIRKKKNYNKIILKKSNNIFSKLFNKNQNISLIKGGGIKYNNSIFRNKNMNHFIQFKSL